MLIDMVTYSAGPARGNSMINTRRALPHRVCSGTDGHLQQQQRSLLVAALPLPLPAWLVRCLDIDRVGGETSPSAALLASSSAFATGDSGPTTGAGAAGATDGPCAPAVALAGEIRGSEKLFILPFAAKASVRITR